MQGCLSPTGYSTDPVDKHGQEILTSKEAVMHHLHGLILFFSLAFCISLGVHAGPVDINSATAETLAETIDGVGLNKALSIVRYRESNGPFTSVDELVQVKGIGKLTVDKNRNGLTASDPAGR